MLAVMRGWASISIGACIALVAPHARAQPIPLTVPSGDVCLEGERLAALVQQHVGGTVIDPELAVEVGREAPATVVFTVRHRADVVSVRRFEDAPGDCAALNDMLALAIAIAVDGHARQPLPVPAPAVPSAPLPAPRALPPARHTAATPPPDRPPTLDAEVEVSGLFGVAPSFAMGGALAVHFVVNEAFDLRASVLGALPSEAPLGGGTVDFALVALRIDACLARALASFRGRACLGAAGGRAFGASHGFETDSSNGAGWVALAGRLGLLAPVARWLAIDAGLDLLIPVVRPSFVAVAQDGSRQETIVPAWGLVVSVGPAVLFP